LESTTDHYTNTYLKLAIYTNNKDKEIQNTKLAIYTNKDKEIQNTKE